jgi:hypothetical protein
METPATYTVSPLTPRAASDNISLPPIDWRAFLEMRLRVLQTELNAIRVMLDKPQRCPHCKCELK